MIKLKYNDIAAEKHFTLIEKTLRDKIKDVIQSGFIEITNKSKKKITTKKYNVDSLLENFLKTLLEVGNLKNLITNKPDELEIQIGTFDSSFLIKKNASNYILRAIFIEGCYDLPIFSKADFVNSIDLDTCPYCNRAYIYSLSKPNLIKPQIDHFYPKSKYPMLGVSFYNLIPSCHTCNGFEAKAQKDPLKFKITNPYKINITDFKFGFRIKSIRLFDPLIDRKSVEVILLKQIKGNSNVFKLEPLYKLHADHVIELIVKSKLKYSDTYRNQLKKFKLTDAEINRMILGNYADVNETHKRPLAKLYQDIGIKLKIIK
jgi:hypothetical protein